MLNSSQFGRTEPAERRRADANWRVNPALGLTNYRSVKSGPTARHVEPLSMPRRLSPSRRRRLVLAVAGRGSLGGCNEFRRRHRLDSPSARRSRCRRIRRRCAPTRTNGRKAYDAKPGEKVASINYARALRALDPLQGGRRGDARRGGEGAEGLRGARRLRQGARRRRANCSRPRTCCRAPIPMERPDWTMHVGARLGRGPARRPRAARSEFYRSRR